MFNLSLLNCNWCLICSQFFAYLFFNLGFRERFMVWNRIGLITQFKSSTDLEDEDENANDFEFHQKSKGSIEIEFHDTTLHHSLRLTNNFNYMMADLSLTGILLASKVRSVFYMCIVLDVEY